MKRLFILLLIVSSLVALTSCEADMRARLVGMMGSLSGNVMGSDTSSADKAIEEARIESSSTTTVNTASGVEVLGVMVNVPAETTYITGITTEKTDAIVSSIADAKRNTASLEKLRSEMAGAADESSASAVKGTAVIYKAVVEELTTDVKDENIKKAVGEITGMLQSIADSANITKADAATVQLMIGFAEAVNENISKNGELVVDSGLISEANSLLVVAETLSPVGSFDIDFGSIISQLVSGSGANGDSARALEEEGTKLEKDAVEYARIAYRTLKPIMDAKNYEGLISGLSRHKAAYETYVSLALSGGSSDLESVASYERLMDYLLASVISEADKAFDAVKNSEEDGKLVCKFKDTFKGYDTLGDVMNAFVGSNPWLDGSGEGDIVLRLPGGEDAWNVSGESPDEKDKEFMQANASGLVSALETVKAMLPYVSLDKFPGVDVAGMIDEVLGYLSPEESSN